MNISEYRTGMILKDKFDCYLVLGIFDYQIEELKRKIEMIDINIL